MVYSIVVPIYNDAALAADFCREVERVFRERLGDRFDTDLELIFVDDGSRNDAVPVLKALREPFPFVKVIALSRNFGQHIAIACGYRHARGDIIAYLNVDQEDPPDQILVLSDALEANDWDIAGGLYTKRDVPWLAKITSHLFTRFLNRLTGYDQPTNGSVIRVMKRRFVETYNSLGERNPYLPGLEMWIGYRYGRVPVTHRKREIGQSSYNFSRRMRMAIGAVISFSDYPLRLAVKFGFAFTAIGVLLILMLAIDRLFFRSDLLPGYVTTIAAIILMGGAQIVVTGIASLYVGRILTEVQGRPLYIVRERAGALPEA